MKKINNKTIGWYLLRWGGFLLYMICSGVVLSRTDIVTYAYAVGAGIGTLFFGMSEIIEDRKMRIKNMNLTAEQARAIQNDNKRFYYCFNSEDGLEELGIIIGVNHPLYEELNKKIDCYNYRGKKNEKTRQI